MSRRGSSTASTVPGRALLAFERAEAHRTAGPQVDLDRAGEPLAEMLGRRHGPPHLVDRVRIAPLDADGRSPLEREELVSGHGCLLRRRASRRGGRRGSRGAIPTSSGTGASQSSSSASGSTRRPYQRRGPSTRTVTNPASRSTRRCLDVSGCVSSSASASSPTRLLADPRSRSRIDRRIGCASTSNDVSIDPLCHRRHMLRKAINRAEAGRRAIYRAVTTGAEAVRTCPVRRRSSSRTRLGGCRRGRTPGRAVRPDTCTRWIPSDVPAAR